jgi:uncharacterized protein (TIGR03663 family)
MSLARSAALFIPILLLGAALRFPRLDLRPMHGDEGINADKLGTLLEHGRYEYSREDFHGPTLYYVSLLRVRMKGISRYAGLDERTLRIVPAVAGMLLVAGGAALIPWLGLPAAAACALLTAVSPAMVFYSRYYIHEMLFVLFSFGALLSLFRYLQRGTALSAAATGTWVGLLHATKETSALVVGSMILAVVVTLITDKELAQAVARFNWRRHCVIAFAVAVLVSAVLLSSFMTNPRGVIDSVEAYRNYVRRGVSVSLHLHPWYYYFNLLLFWRSGGGPVWTEALIVGLAAAGLWVGLRKNGAAGTNPSFGRLAAFYTVFVTVFFSAVPYKTPWNLLPFVHGMIILAGIGAAHLIRLTRGSMARTVATAALLVFASAHLGWQAWAASFRYPADPRNPWVYAHTGNDVFLIARQMAVIARAHPEALAMPIQIISRENLWPLPWYLRSFSGVRWWNGVSDSGPAAPLILATPDMEPALVRKLYELPPPGQREMYVPLFDRYVELRPRIELRGYVAKPLWDACQSMQSAPGSRQ